ncbi:uncharacterized protein LOC126829630 [Patella vulgata]|uniref:uncharacterized protein LOC126829630 n=1 Tax=Patella vulgata TaxID=6465 RepID=UPI0024AA0045|nr:uncharacterized protein LOC126829630 [Patella vulgata]XP_050415569.2 uncharacterized protein LOC126829630 [Patella vulgata]
MGFNHHSEEAEDKKDEEDEREGQSGPPDGGWGWVVMLGSLMCNVIVDGVCLTFGVVAEELTREFNVPISQVIWVGSLLTGSYLTVGPLVSAMAVRYGCRKVTIIGSLVASGAFLLSTQSNSLEMLIITYGLLGGIGFGMIYLPSIVMVGYWFEKKRAFATGIAVCGSGIGTFVFAPFGRYLLDEYGWRGTNAIMAGIILNCMVCGALFRPLQKRGSKRAKRGVVQRGSIMKALIEEKKRQRTISNGSLDNCIITKDNRLIKLDPALFDAKSRNNSLVARLKESLGFSTKSLNKSQKSLVIPSILIANGSPQMTKPIYKPGIKSPTKPALSPSSDSGCSTSLDAIIKARSCDMIPQNDPWSKLSIENSLNRKSLSYHNVNQHSVMTSGLGASLISIQVIPNSSVAATQSRTSLQHLNNRLIRSSRSMSYSSRLTNPATIVSGSVMSIPQYSASVQSFDSEMNDGRSISSKIISVLKEMFDFHLLKSRMFSLLVFSSILTMLGFFVPFFYLVKKASEIGVGQKEGVFLLSIIGMTNTLGRVISGWIADRPWADPLYINNGALILTGVATAVCPFFNSYIGLAFYSAVFGIGIAVFVSLRSILLVDLLGLEMLTKSFGILILFQGIASIAGSPLTGRLICATSNVDGTFYLAGALIAVSGVMGIPLRLLKSWDEAKLPPPLPEEMPINETLKIEQVETAI